MSRWDVIDGFGERVSAPDLQEAIGKAIDADLKLQDGALEYYTEQATALASNLTDPDLTPYTRQRLVELGFRVLRVKPL